MPEDEEKYHWFVVFKEHQAPYTYKFRTMAYMVDVVTKHRDRYGIFPFGMWVMVGDEVRKVEIK